MTSRFNVRFGSSDLVHRFDPESSHHLIRTPRRHPGLTLCMLAHRKSTKPTDDPVTCPTCLRNLTAEQDAA